MHARTQLGSGGSGDSSSSSSGSGGGLPLDAFGGDAAGYYAAGGDPFAFDRQLEEGMVRNRDGSLRLTEAEVLANMHILSADLGGGDASGGGGDSNGAQENYQAFSRDVLRVRGASCVCVVDGWVDREGMSIDPSDFRDSHGTTLTHTHPPTGLPVAASPVPPRGPAAARR